MSVTCNCLITVCCKTVESETGGIQLCYPSDLMPEYREQDMIYCSGIHHHLQIHLMQLCGILNTMLHSELQLYFVEYTHNSMSYLGKQFQI